MTDGIAIAHDQFRTMGGAERVACEIARAFDAPIYAMRVDQGVVPDDVTVRRVASDTGEWLMRRHFLVQDAYQMLAWQHVEELYQFDTIIQTKNNPAWFVPNADTQTVVRYCHSTPRGMYDQFRRRGGDVIGDALKTVQRLLYQQTTPYADRWICNSETVARRVRMYADPAEAGLSVVHPPVDTHKTGPQAAETVDYYFFIGRLAVNKRVDLLADVARAVDVPVVVAGEGPYKEELLTDAPPNLDYLGYITEREKWQRLSEAAATFMLAENEDFGITPIESFAAGTPVIGVREGFTRHQIQGGKNGHLTQPTVEAVKEAITRHERGGVDWTPQEIAAFADQFGVERFRAAMRREVAAARNAAAVEPEFASPIGGVVEGVSDAGD